MSKQKKHIKHLETLVAQIEKKLSYDGIDVAGYWKREQGTVGALIRLSVRLDKIEKEITLGDAAKALFESGDKRAVERVGHLEEELASIKSLIPPLSALAVEARDAITRLRLNINCIVEKVDMHAVHELEPGLQKTVNTHETAITRLQDAGGELATGLSELRELTQSNRRGGLAMQEEQNKHSETIIWLQDLIGQKEARGPATRLDDIFARLTAVEADNHRLVARIAKLEEISLRQDDVSGHFAGRIAKLELYFGRGQDSLDSLEVCIAKLESDAKSVQIDGTPSSVVDHGSGLPHKINPPLSTLAEPDGSEARAQ